MVLKSWAICGTRNTSRAASTPSTTTSVSAGYISRRRVCEISSSCHLSVSARFLNTSGSWPVCSPALIRLMKTLSKTSVCAAMHCDSTLPPSMSSLITASTSRKRGLSALSRMSRSPSMMGMPERIICSMSKQKLTRSWRVILTAASFEAWCSTTLYVIRSSPMRRRRSSRSTSLTASSPPRAGRPALSTALYWKEGI
jgi:hypothetical protein